MQLILGSKSAARREVLERAGFKFTVMSADIDEKAIRNEDPKELTLALANAKADVLLPKITGAAILITADLVVLCVGQMYEKPEGAQQAREYFRSYRENPATTVTAVVVSNTQTSKRVQGTDVATVWFRSIPDDVIEQVIATGDPFTHAGGFNIEHPLLKPYVERVEGDRESILGLPLKLTHRLIARVSTV